MQLQAGSGRQATRLAGLKSLQLADARIDLLARQVAVGTLRIDQPGAQLARLADGQIDLSPWLPRQAPTSSAAATPAGPDWRLSLQTLAVQGGRLAWTDAAAATDGQPLRAELSGLAVQWQGLAWPATAKTPPSRLRLSAKVGPPSQPGAVVTPGRIDWNGRVGLAPLLADGRLQLDRLPVHLFVPYAGDALPAALLHADASLTMQLRAQSTPAGLQLNTDGDLQITEVMLHTRPGPGEAAGSELLSWESLALQGVSVTLRPPAKPQIAVRELALTDFYSRLVITEQGRFNLQDIAAAEPAAPAASAPADPGLPIDLALGQTTLRNGRIDFSDRFVRPNYSARLTELNGTVGALRSGTREMATISLRGRAADTALLDISGQLNPTVQPLALDIRAKATDLELAPLSPYAGKYAGYAIERGKLSMDVAYRIDADGKLDAKNQVVLNQLTFGERVESPSATQLPVLLAVALLKDRNGVIDINLPVSGTVSDPQFSVGAIIWKVIVNLPGQGTDGAVLAAGRRWCRRPEPGPVRPRHRPHHRRRPRRAGQGGHRPAGAAQPDHGRHRRRRHRLRARRRTAQPARRTPGRRGTARAGAHCAAGAGRCGLGTPCATGAADGRRTRRRAQAPVPADAAARPAAQPDQPAQGHPAGRDGGPPAGRHRGQ